MMALLFGLFGQVAFFADFGRGAIPIWLRIGAHMAILVPLLFLEPRPGSRTGHAILAIAAGLYLGTSAVSVGLVLRGLQMPGLMLYLVLEAVGAVAATPLLAQAVQGLEWPRPPDPEPFYRRPWAGAYRTRPAVPPVPPPAPPPAPPRSREPHSPVGFALLSMAFVAAGLFMLLHATRPDQLFWGLVCVVFFGLATWVFWEQVAAGTQVLPPAAQRRVQGGLVLVGVVMAWTAYVFPEVDAAHRALIGGVGVLGVIFGWRAVWRSRRAGGR
jgi:hypothetical protein